MARGYDEGQEKRTFSLTINPALVEELKTECHIDNLSGWVNERIREHILNNKVVLECVCGYCTNPHNWNRLLGVCPTCKADHIKLDRRKRIKVEGI